MGTHENVGYYEFPVQNDTIGQAVEIPRTGNSGKDILPGKIVRDDLADPLITIIELEDGSVVLGDEKDGYIEPEQGEWLGARADVCFRRDPSKIVGGEIVRDDTEEPFRTVIKLDIGRYVMSTECQYALQPM